MFTDEELKEMLTEAESKKTSAQINPGELCWFRNQEFIESDTKGNSTPFFVAEIVSADEETETVE